MTPSDASPLLRPLPPMPEWMPDAVCNEIGPEVFFVDDQQYDVIHDRLIKEHVCGPCPFRAPCLEFAITYNLLGLWGGTTRGQRRLIIAERYRDAEAAAAAIDDPQAGQAA